MDLLKNLNQQQKSAVRATEGPLLVLAGAGSGKTKVIAHRIAYIIGLGTKPSEILAVTFTNKAAGEMKERVLGLLGARGFTTPPFIGTFHALGVYILRHFGQKIGIQRNFTILDEDDSKKIIKDVIKDLQLDPSGYKPERIHNSISTLKNELVDIASFEETHTEGPYQKNLRLLYSAYEAALYKMNGLDFDDLLLKTVMLLDDHDDVREYYQNKWKYIHIDEYQDTNTAQYKLSHILARRHRNIAVVGDVDQAIYSWRGADWHNILRFEEDWKDARLIALEENYRSTQIILDAANAVITHNTERKEKNLRSQKSGGNTIDIAVAQDEKREAQLIVEYISALLSAGERPGNVAVLFRTNAQSRALEEAFIHADMAYKLVSGVKFYERKEIKDLLAYLRYATNPNDRLALKRIINTPPRGIGKVLQGKYINKNDVTEGENKKIRAFENLISALKHKIRAENAGNVIREIIKKAGFKEYYNTGKETDADRLGNMQELISLAKKYDADAPPSGIEKLLEDAALLTEAAGQETASGAVQLLTAHAAKGLEFGTVIIAGMEEGLFPHSLAEVENNVEEERRLFYVALTRAKERVLITLTNKRLLRGEMTFNEPSRFISEVPGHLFSNKLLSEEPGDDEETIII